MFRFAIFALAAIPCVAFAGEDHPKPPHVLDYPADLREFRRKALSEDGAFAPDIVFTVRTCPFCHKPYVFGTFPRLSHQPFDDLAGVHAAVEECIKRPPPATVYSKRTHAMVARACPYCGEREENATPDRALFCHNLLETGDDLQIEYDAKDGKLTS